MKKRLALFLLLVLVAVIWYHNVPKNISAEDMTYIKIYLQDVDPEIKAAQLSYDEQIELIKTVQSNVLQISPVGEGVPFSQERRPKDLYEFGEGLCYDRSFVMELIFQHLGFRTRHVSLYKDLPEMSTLTEMTTKQIKSHAISEVETKKGWLIIDSNLKWIGLDDKNLPVSARKLNNAVSDISWASHPEIFFYREKHHYIYGLYSRHGKFYKPFNFIPDYNIRELLYNLN